MESGKHIKDPNQGFFEIIKNTGGKIPLVWKKGDYYKMHDNSDVIKLIFQNDKYRIVRGDSVCHVKAIERKMDESDEEYRERAIKEFDDYCDSQQNFKRKMTPEIIKSRKIGITTSTYTKPRIPL